MTLPRYKFEILKYLEKNGAGNYTHRQLSDSLTISNTEIMRDIDEMVQEGLVVHKGDYLSITANGLNELEPYRVKRAVILAAGFGSRMMPATSDRPKPMVTVKGKRIIDTLLDSLIEVGIKDITLVRGYQREKFDELLNKYPFIKFIDNVDYDKFNNISSAVLLKDNFIGGSYLCEADLYITNSDVICKYQYTSNILGSWSMETDDWSFKMTDSGYIRDYQKGNTNCWNYYGISYWTADDCDKLNRDWANYFAMAGGKDIFWEQVPLQLKKDNYQVEIRQCQKSDIMEIDNYYELAQLDSSYKTK